MKKIAIVDDNNLLRQNILDRLTGKYEIFFETDLATDLIDALNNGQGGTLPDLILMDIEMDEMDGITATAILKSKYPEIKIVMLSVFEQDEKVWESIMAGADGYILKDEPKEKLLSSIDDVLQDGSYMSPAIARKVMTLLQNRNNRPDQSAFSELSRREIEILEEVATGKNYKQIGETLFVSVATVKTHINHIYKKLQVKNKVEAINRLKAFRGSKI